MLSMVGFIPIPGDSAVVEAAVGTTRADTGVGGMPGVMSRAGVGDTRAGAVTAVAAGAGTGGAVGVDGTAVGVAVGSDSRTGVGVGVGVDDAAVGIGPSGDAGGAVVGVGAGVADTGGGITFTVAVGVGGADTGTTVGVAFGWAPDNTRAKVEKREAEAENVRSVISKAVSRSLQYVHVDDSF